MGAYSSKITIKMILPLRSKSKQKEYKTIDYRNPVLHFANKYAYI